MTLTSPVAAMPPVRTLIAEKDWAATPLGPAERWPQSLRTSISICLASRFPILIWWGPELAKIYNDAYAEILGGKHPSALGRPGRDVWPEIWDIIGPMLRGVMERGDATWSKDQFLPLHRRGFAEECYFTFSYSPIEDESGGVAGVFTAVSETTEKVLGARRLEILRELADRAGSAVSGSEAARLASEVLGNHTADLPFALIYLENAAGELALAGSAGLEPGSPAAPLTLSHANARHRAAWPVAEGSQMLTVRDLDMRFGALPGGPWPEPTRLAVVLPIMLSSDDGGGRPTGELIAGISPRLMLDSSYTGFLELVAGQIGTAIETATAREAERARTAALAELDRAKTIFFSNISHEFRTPLTLLLGPLEDALSRPDGALAQADLEVAHRNALRLLRLVNSLLQFARTQAGRVDASYEQTDLATCTAELAGTFRSAVERAGLRLVVDTPPLPSHCTVYVDRRLWEMIVLNLLSNAFKFTFSGEIRVTLRPDPDMRTIRLEVSDTGVGIPEGELARVFDRFHRVEGSAGRTYEGSGIGLALVRDLVEVHGGSITVTSTVGDGSTFTVQIPVGPEHLPQDRVRPEASPTSAPVHAAAFVEEALRWVPEDTDTTPELKQAHARIVLADDNADMRAYLTRLLSDRFDIQAVADGEAALQACLDHPPDLVLSDVMMPRMDGVSLIRALRADSRTRHVPTVLLSARAGEEARLEGLEAGADDYLSKPFTAAELIARVRTSIDLARARQETARREQVARAEAEAERERMRSLLMQAPAAISILEGPELRFTLVNPLFQQILGSDRKLAGKPVREALPEIETQGYVRLLEQVYTTGERYVGTAMRVDLDRRGDGNLDAVYFNFVYEPTRNARGEVDSIFVHAVDVTEQVLALERANELAQEATEARDLAESAVQARDEFLSIASHELRTPVATVLALAQLMRRQRDRGSLDDQRLARHLGSLQASTERLGRLVDDLLDVSRLRTGQLRLRLSEVDLEALVRTAVDEARDAGGSCTILLEVGSPPGGYTVSGDADRLVQVVSNLLDNAIKYSPEGGEIRVAMYRSAGSIVVEVKDHGIGLPPGSEELIFEPFGRAHNAEEHKISGMGLGMYVSRQIALAHGGSLSARSDGDGMGSTFTLSLPQ